MRIAPTIQANSNILRTSNVSMKLYLSVPIMVVPNFSIETPAELNLSVISEPLLIRKIVMLNPAADAARPAK